MKRDRTTAEIWRRLLLHGLTTEEEIVACADSLIADRDQPPPWALEVSICGTKADIISTLSRVPGAHNQSAVWAALASRWLVGLDRATPAQVSSIAKALYHAAQEGDLPEEGAQDEMMRLWDAVDLARAGVYGSLDAETAALRDLLNKVIANAPAQQDDEV